ncbi:MAG: hypothetical protein JJU31_10085 [Wenzhouxiangella sp.]|nr:hypothetical protein [Wenzhouxiangella sp.]
MRYKTVRDILNEASALHDKLAALSYRAAEASKDRRSGLVLDYLADHQNQLRKAITAFEDDAAERVMATWFDRSPELDLPEVQATDLADVNDLEALIEKVVEFHDRITELYANLRDQSRAQEVRAVFASLAELERHEKMELTHSTRQLQDI